MADKPQQDSDKDKRPMMPGDEAAKGTPGTGEDICRTCRGTGQLENGRTCEECGGTGIVVEGIGGG
ncbi:hypothetical protein [Telmatospirillum sp. J64-1]|uniref:hypothetical protein n=1 Tax=Telmatospirillum sp. J64-1 TaxID=2502183 RepID=UPI00115C6BDF|nr:hypothetical protein [Telmatospirillum sp. J64-1]